MSCARTLLLGLAALPGDEVDFAFVDATEEARLVALHQCAGPLAFLCEMGGGAGVGDFDRDGWPDVFVLGGGVWPDRLFMNRRDGTFREEAGTRGVARVHAGIGVAVGDVDGDGWLDVYVTSLGDAAAPSPGRHLLYRNLGGGVFTDVARASGVHATSPVYADGFGAAFGDIDLDGDLDLFVAGWRAVPEPSLGNRLFVNDGSGVFTDASGVKIHVPPGTRGFAPTFCDVDGDRFPELLLAADFGTSRYFVNDGAGNFVDATASAGVGLDANGMGSVVADLDNDLWMDWYVTSVHDPKGWSPLKGDGNKLYWGAGGHRFDEGAARSGVDAGWWGWGAVAFDVDHDGWTDLFETNGFGLFPEFLGLRSRLWRNAGGRTFEEVAVAAGLVHLGDGRGVIDLDYDRDGDRDLIVTANGARPRLFRNELRAERHFLGVRLDTSARPDLAPDGFGARVEVETAAGRQVRVIDGGSRYLTSSELVAHFGLGEAGRVERVVVKWADGGESVLEGVAGDRYVTVVAR